MLRSTGGKKARTFGRLLGRVGATATRDARVQPGRWPRGRGGRTSRAHFMAAALCSDTGRRRPRSSTCCRVSFVGCQGAPPGRTDPAAGERAVAEPGAWFLHFGQSTGISERAKGHPAACFDYTSLGRRRDVDRVLAAWVKLSEHLFLVRACADGRLRTPCQLFFVISAWLARAVSDSLCHRRGMRSGAVGGQR